jgi:hypothetical protein
MGEQVSGYTHTVPYISGLDTPLPGGIWADLVKVRDALRAGVSDPAELRRMVCSCSSVENLLDLGQRLRLFDEPEADKGVTKFEGDLLQWPGGGMNLAMLRALLARAGLAIIPAADVPSAEEREVLDDVVRIVADWIDDGDEADTDVSMQQIETVAGVQVAHELARRAAKEGK